MSTDAATRKRKRDGGASQWLLVDPQGAVLACPTATRPYRAYAAPKPSQAACKAFYAFLRSDDGKRALGAHLAARQNASPSPPAGGASPPDAAAGEEPLRASLAQQRAAAVASGDAAAVARLDAYAAACAEVPRGTYSFSVGVCLRSASGTGGVRQYVVRYHAVKEPNRHELACRIHKVARPAWVRGGAGMRSASSSGSLSGGSGGSGGSPSPVAAAGATPQQAPFCVVALHDVYATMPS